MSAQYLDEALRAAGIPILGVSPQGSTWRVDFAPEATQAQKDQAAVIVASYTDPTPNTLLDKNAELRTSEKALTATAQALWECIPAPTMTKAQLKARAKAIFKNGNGA